MRCGPMKFAVAVGDDFLGFAFLFFSLSLGAKSGVDGARTGGGGVEVFVSGYDKPSFH